MCAREAVPKDFEEKCRQRFSEIADPDVTFEQFLAYEKREYLRVKQLEQNPNLRYQPSIQRGMTPCGNGDFDTELTPEWEGAYIGASPVGVPDFSTFTSGIYEGPITDVNSHQTRVGVGLDPFAGISLTAPNSS